MKLTHLLEHHRKFSGRGLPGSLGDGYLVVHNRFYRWIREAALASGFRFSAEKNEAFESFPLLQLENILRARVLPYVNNAAALEQLTPVQLLALDWQDVDGNLKKNYVFHEGCHAVVRGLAGEVLGPSGEMHDLKTQRRFALRMLLEESCANTVELLGTVDANDQIHRLFFEMNSYMGNFENRTNVKNAFAEIGEATVIKFVTLAYLQANFLREKIEDREFAAMIRFATGGAELDAKKQKSLRALSKVAFQLSERFRVQTTSFHLRLAGIKTPAKELFGFDFMGELKSGPYREVFDRWAGLGTFASPQAPV